MFTAFIKEVRLAEFISCTFDCLYITQVLFQRSSGIRTYNVDAALSVVYYCPSKFDRGGTGPETVGTSGGRLEPPRPYFIPTGNGKIWLPWIDFESESESESVHEVSVYRSVVT